jgi:hypothetical protein
LWMASTVAVAAQKTIGKGLIFTQQTQQKVLGLNVWTAKLARFIAGEKNYAPCLLRILFKHHCPSCNWR